MQFLHEENWGKWFKKMCPTKWPQFEIRLKECDRNSYMKKLIFKVTCDLKEKQHDFKSANIECTICRPKNGMSFFDQTCHFWVRNPHTVEWCFLTIGVLTVKQSLEAVSVFILSIILISVFNTN